MQKRRNERYDVIMLLNHRLKHHLIIYIKVCCFDMLRVSISDFLSHALDLICDRDVTVFELEQVVD